MMHKVRGLAVVGISILGAVMVPTMAQATPSSGVSARIIYQVTAGHTDFVLREITIQPGGSTGWHWHDGTLFGRVEAGTLTHTDADCTTVATYRAGQGIVEPSGAGNVHIGRNLGPTPLVLEVLYVNPAGAPLAEDAADPGCGI
jgi:quercetin dioxygenase-like cupin family protein